MRKSHPVAGRIAAAALVLAAFVVGIAIATSDLARAADAARRAPRMTHIGVAPADFVLLDLVDIGATEERFVRINPDATRDDDEFEVPNGRVFVLTGYHVVGRFAFGRDTTVRFWMKNAESGDRLPVLADAAIEETDGNSGVRGSLTEGIVFGAGTVLQADALSSGFLHVYGSSFRPLDASNRGYAITVRGYLVDAE